MLQWYTVHWDIFLISTWSNFMKNPVTSQGLITCSTKPHTSVNFLTLNIAVQFLDKLHQDISKVTGILQTLSVLFKMGIYKSMHVKLWTRHWIPFLDKMLQIELNRFYTTSEYLHTDITKMPLYFLLNFAIL